MRKVFVVRVLVFCTLTTAYMSVAGVCTFSFKIFSSSKHIEIKRFILFKLEIDIENES